LKWHPKLSKYDPDLTYHNFCEISEAYEVLGDCEHSFCELALFISILAYKRAFYDKYGEEQLKDGFLVDGSKNKSFYLNLNLIKTSEEDIDLEEILKRFLRSSLVPIILLLILLVRIYTLYNL